MSGSRVALKDASLELAERGIARLSTVLDRAIAKGRFEQQNKEATLARIIPTDAWDPFEETEVVVEAVFEDFSVKREVFKKLGQSVCVRMPAVHQYLQYPDHAACFHHETWATPPFSRNAFLCTRVCDAAGGSHRGTRDKRTDSN